MKDFVSVVFNGLSLEYNLLSAFIYQSKNLNIFRFTDKKDYMSIWTLHI